MHLRIHPAVLGSRAGLHRCVVVGLDLSDDLVYLVDCVTELNVVLLRQILEVGGGLLKTLRHFGRAIDYALAGGLVSGRLSPGRGALKEIVQAFGDSGIPRNVENGLQR